jgi:hypothetical protein
VVDAVGGIGVSSSGWDQISLPDVAVAVRGQDRVEFLRLHIAEVQRDFPPVAQEQILPPAADFALHALDLVVEPQGWIPSEAGFGSQDILNARLGEQVVCESQHRLWRRVELQHEDECKPALPDAQDSCIVEIVAFLDVLQPRRHVRQDRFQVRLVALACLVSFLLVPVEQVVILNLTASDEFWCEIFHGFFLALRRGVS